MIALVKVDTHSGLRDHPPLGLLYTGNALKKAGYDVEVFHFGKDQISYYARLISKKEPLYIGCSVLTGLPTLYTSEFSKEVRKISDVPIVWGGVHLTLLPEQTIRENYIDYGVMGEGEETSVDLAKCLERKQNPLEVKGLIFKRNGKIVRTENRPFIKNLDEHRMDWSLIDLEKYFRKSWASDKTISFVTSRGCPHNCAFCYNLCFNRRKWRAHSIQWVISEVEFLKENYDVDGIYFYDDNFFVNKKRAVEIIEKIDIPWSGDIRIDYIDKALAKRMNDNKCAELLIGVESGSDRILKLINKGFTTADIINGMKILAEYPYIRPGFSFILGLPTETKKETFKTIDMILKCAEINPRSSFTIGTYLPYPGTELYELAIENGFKPPDKTEDWYIVDRWTKTLNLPWINTEMVYYVRSCGHHLTSLIPLAKNIARFRLKHKFFKYPVDLMLLDWIKNRVGMNDAIGKMLREIGYRIYKKEYQR